jgi:nucleoside-diphosphate-sugar epimerase
MKVLVTGSSGLIGRQLVKLLRGRGDVVMPFDLRPGSGETVSDIRDEDRLRAAIAGCDGVYHLAAVSRVAWGEIDPDTCLAINVEATSCLVDAAVSVGAPWIVFASSREVYGDPVTSPVREDDEIAPVNVYGHSKADAEEIIAAGREAGLATATIRLSNVYGTLNDHPDRAVPALMWRALQGQPITLTGGNNYFDFVHVDDCVEGLRSAADRLVDGERSLPPVHLATGVPTSLIELAETAKEICGSSSPIEIAPARAYDVAGFCGAPDFAEATLDWRARTPLAEGLRRLRTELQATRRGFRPVPRPAPHIGGVTLT